MVLFLMLMFGSTALLGFPHGIRLTTLSSMFSITDICPLESSFRVLFRGLVVESRTGRSKFGTLISRGHTGVNIS
jgi:hypothetical protein